MDEQYKIAVAATAPAAGFPNLQLGDWIDAKSKFYDLNEENYQWDKAVLIVNLLGNSLTKLFGVNHQPQNWTPSLLSYVEKEFPSKNWNLKMGNVNLYERFKKLDDLYKDVTKHFDHKKAERARIEFATLDCLAHHMETTRLMWIWFLQKRTGTQPIPVDQLTEFQDSFESND